jgi:hypothetical protein
MIKYIGLFLMIILVCCAAPSFAEDNDVLVSGPSNDGVSEQPGQPQQAEQAKPVEASRAVTYTDSPPALDDDKREDWFNWGDEESMDDLRENDNLQF